jgi:FkbM family methyltransferase
VIKEINVISLSKPIKLAFVRAVFKIYPFRALPRSKTFFRDWSPGKMLRRRLFGFDYFCDVSRDGPQFLIYLLGERHISEAALFKSLLRPGMRVADVGANIGYYVLMIAQAIGPSGYVYAIEPSPENLPELRTNIEANGISATVLPVAVGNRPATVGFLAGINGGIVVAQERAPYQVQQQTLDDLIPPDGIDFLKLDIEGHEHAALMGAERLLQSRPTIFVEIHPRELRRQGSSAKAVVSLLTAYYQDLALYEAPSPHNMLAKILRDYGLTNSIRRVKDVVSYLDCCEQSEIANPFWAVAGIKSAGRRPVPRSARERRIGMFVRDVESAQRPTNSQACSESSS